MNSTALINEVKTVHPSWSRTAIREMINDEQNRIYSSIEAQPLRLIDSTTGKDVILTTTAGQSVYEISAANGYDEDVWKVKTVKSFDGTDISVSDNFGDTNTVRTVEASKSNAAKVIFDFDPGEGTKFYLESYTRPTQLLSENTDITLPFEFHKPYLFEAVLGLIERKIHGVSNRYSDYEQRLLPELRALLTAEYDDALVSAPTHTTSLISRLKRVAPDDWTREDLLRELNSIQEMIYQKAQSTLRIIDTTTGKDPLLTTVAGTTYYELSDIVGTRDVWSVKEIRRANGDVVAVTDEFKDSKTVSVIRASGGKDAAVYFNFDPGNDEYFVVCYERPAELLNEQIDITLPTEFHIPYLFEGVAARIEQIANKNAERWLYFIQNLLPQVVDMLKEKVDYQAIGTQTGTSELITAIQPLVAEWNRVDILREINYIQKLIYSMNKELLPVYINGKSPVLTTADGVFEYTLNSDAPAIFNADPKWIKEVKTASGNIVSVNDQYGDTKRVMTIDGNGTSDPRVIFNFDPGIDTYYVTCYEEVPEILNENDELTLPDEYVWSYLFEGVEARISLVRDGNSEKYVNFVSSAIPSLNKKLKDSHKMQTVHGATAITEFVESVQSEVPDVTSEDVLREINFIQKQVFGVSHVSHEIIDPATGKSPILTYIADQYEYDLDVANFGYAVTAVISITYLCGDEVHEIITRKQKGVTPAKVIFQSDHSTGDEFYVKCYAGITDVDNENSPLSIPEEYIYPYLYEGVVGRLTQYKKGGSNRLLNFNNRLLPELVWKMDIEYNNQTERVPKRGF